MRRQHTLRFDEPPGQEHLASITERCTRFGDNYYTLHRNPDQGVDSVRARLFLCMSHENIVPQQRDIAILRELSESRAVAIRHLAAFYFLGSRGAAYKRLQSLHKAGLIDVYRTTPGYPDIVQLTIAGYKLLSDHQVPVFLWPQVQRRQCVSDSVLRHELAVMDVRASLARGSKYGKLRQFLTHRIDRMFLNPPSWRCITRPTPDAYIRLSHAASRANHFFLEVDTGSQRHQIIEDKIRAYRQIKRLGLAVQKPRAHLTAPAMQFRVLFVCLTDGRRDGLIACLQNMHPPVRSFAVVMTLSELESKGLESAA